MFHHALLCGVSGNSVRFLEHHKEHRLLDVQLSLDVTSLDNEVPRVLGEPTHLGHAVRWLTSLARGMSDDRK